MRNIFLKASILFVCIAMLVLTGCTQESSETYTQSDIDDTNVLENVHEQDNIIENTVDIRATTIEKNNSKQVIIITGTASGIGKASAEKLIANGHIVY
jgi:hypothetical protein